MLFFLTETVYIKFFLVRKLDFLFLFILFIAMFSIALEKVSHYKINAVNRIGRVVETLKLK